VKKMSNKDIVDRFFEKWQTGNIAGAMDECTEDAVWNNVPMKPIEGKAAIESFLTKFAKGMSDIHYDISYVMEEGDRLMLEGVENYTKSGHKVSVPYMASFQFRGGKIAAWADYFDLTTVERQLGLKST
jgi:limonene-1,2-epoxide hydrolase